MRRLSSLEAVVFVTNFLPSESQASSLASKIEASVDQSRHHELAVRLIFPVSLPLSIHWSMLGIKPIHRRGVEDPQDNTWSASCDVSKVRTVTFFKSDSTQPQSPHGARFSTNMTLPDLEREPSDTDVALFDSTFSCPAFR